LRPRILPFAVTYLALGRWGRETSAMGGMARLTRVDDSAARRWPGLFRTDTRRRLVTLVAYQTIAAVVLFVGIGTGSWIVASIAIYPILATLVELVRLMPARVPDNAE